LIPNLKDLTMQNTTTTCSTFHDGQEVQLMAHPDGNFKITIQHVNDNFGDYGILRMTDEHGTTTTATLGGIGLIELGVDLIRHAKQMIE
jgi:hypothetical protein